jgi:glutamyl-Q tRNA(Asp) synthetase
VPSRPVFRFAPSPNGELHLGHAYSALLNFDLAERLGGRMLLRIEDIDTTRCRPEFVASIFEDLRWLGISFEEPVRRQSTHLADYQLASTKLQAAGLLYPCFATRTEIEATAGASAKRDPDGASIYPGLWRGADPLEVARRKRAGEPYALRLDMHRAVSGQARSLAWFGFEPNQPSMMRNRPASPDRWGDAVIVRKEIPTSYHLSVVVDDALQGVTHVVRGQDLEAATDLHRLLQALLGLPSPLYHHHRLIVGPVGRKLSKSFGDTSLGQLRREGATPSDVRQLVDLV